MKFNEPIEKKPIHDGVILLNRFTGQKFAVIQIIPTNDLEVRHFIRKFVSDDNDFLFMLFMIGYNETRNEKDNAKKYNLITYSYGFKKMSIDNESSLECKYNSSTFEQIDTI